MWRCKPIQSARRGVRTIKHLAGINNCANNLFYTKNTTKTFNEIVYYCGMVGIVASWVQDDPANPGVKQRFFFGHDNDIMCIAIHPNNRFVATGQQTTARCKPYCCVWDIGDYAKPNGTRTADDVATAPVQLQRIELDKEYRSVLAVAFSATGTIPQSRLAVVST